MTHYCKGRQIASAMTYNEYGQVLDAGVSEDELVTFKYENQGVATLEDGIYVLEDNLNDPAFADKMVRFVKSMKGWKYAEANPGELRKLCLITMKRALKQRRIRCE